MDPWITNFVPRQPFSCQVRLCLIAVELTYNQPFFVYGPWTNYYWHWDLNSLYLARAQTAMLPCSFQLKKVTAKSSKLYFGFKLLSKIYSELHFYFWSHLMVSILLFLLHPTKLIKLLRPDCTSISYGIEFLKFRSGCEM